MSSHANSYDNNPDSNHNPDNNPVVRGENFSALAAIPSLVLTTPIFDQLADAICYLDIEGKFLRANQAFCCLVGCTEAELLNLTWGEFDRQGSRPTWQDDWRSIQQQGSLAKLVQCRKGQQDSIELLLTLSHLQVEQEECCCVLAREPMLGEQQLTQADASQALTKLEFSLALLNATLNSAAYGIVAISREDELLFYNPKFAEMWRIPESVELSRECSRAKTFFESQLNNPTVFNRSVWRVSSQSIEEGYEVLELKDGRVFAQYAKPQWLNGEIIGRVWSIWDMTELQVAQDVQQQQQRQQFGSNQQSSDSSQSGELKTRFISNICHQFRSLLNIISFSNSLLKRHTDEWTAGQKQPYLNYIQTAVGQISQLLDEVLLFGQSEVGQVDFVPVRLNVVEFCQELVKTLRSNPVYETRSIVLTHQGGSSMAYVDPQALNLILVNLLSNALKYSAEPSPIQFRISVLAEQYVFQIQDFGIGILGLDQSRLFEPFYRGSNIGQVYGTGLGLATVKNLVGLLGGEVQLQSQESIGTTVTVILPVKDSADQLR